MTWFLTFAAFMALGIMLLSAFTTIIVWRLATAAVVGVVVGLFWLGGMRSRTQ